MSPFSLRPDLQQIADIVQPRTRVLDLGCCDGELLSYLTEHKHVDGRGIEISTQGVSRCVQNGLAVIQGDVENDLQFYPDGCFDYVISSQVLQATHEPRKMLEECLRVGKHVVVSIPNFGHWQTRYYLTSKGRMPVTKALSYSWYETPNIHFCTTKDFVELCHDVDAEVEDIRYLTGGGHTLPWYLRVISPNLFAGKAVFLLSKRPE